MGRFQQGISDEAVQKATGKDWQFWFNVLDDMNWYDNGRSEVMDILNNVYGLSDRWSQSVTTYYETARRQRRN